MEAFRCQRCGLPLFVSSDTSEPARARIWHVHASTKDAKGALELDLHVRGRGGCPEPTVTVE